MATRRRKKILLTTRGQRRAVASTVRMEMIERLGATGPLTVAALAERMDRSPSSLYHHVRLMLDAGLLRQVDRRRSGAREQAVYDITADLFELASDSASEEVDRAELRVVRVVLREAEREFEEALATHPAEVRAGDFFAARMRARLSRTNEREVRRHLGAIQKIFSEELSEKPHPNAKPRMCSFTGAFLPSR